MILCLDVGNTNIYGGLFDGENILLRFRQDTRHGGTSDQIGVFLKGVLRENNIAVDQITKIAICSVVPPLDYSLRAACIKYFDMEPFFLQAGVKTKLKITCHNPAEVGADRIANAIAAVHQFSDKPLIVVDFGTATTFCAITKEREYLGGVILAGIRLSMDALGSNTAKLASVEIRKPQRVVGRNTAENIQSGLYYGHLGIIREMTQRIQSEEFAGEAPIIIGTGGFAHLFEEEQLFSIIIPDLVLHGLKLALALNDV